MTPVGVLVAVSSLACLVAVAAVLLVVLRTRGRGPVLVGRLVVVSTIAGEGVRGVMVGDHRDRVSLHQASVIDAKGSETQAGGVVHIPAGQVLFIQELAGGG